MLYLPGWSFGGVVAHEMAVELRRRGLVVQGILLIDSPNPAAARRPLSEPLIDAVVNSERLDGRNASSGDSRLRKLVKDQFRINSQLLGEYRPESCGSGDPVVFLRSKEGFNPSSVMDIPGWLKDRRDDSGEMISEWESIAGVRVRVIDIPGNHFQAFDASNVRCLFLFSFFGVLGFDADDVVWCLW